MQLPWADPLIVGDPGPGERAGRDVGGLDRTLDKTRSSAMLILAVSKGRPFGGSNRQFNREKSRSGRPHHGQTKIEFRSFVPVTVPDRSEAESSRQQRTTGPTFRFAPAARLAAGNPRQKPCHQISRTK